MVVREESRVIALIFCKLILGHVLDFRVDKLMCILIKFDYLQTYNV